MGQIDLNLNTSLASSISSTSGLIANVVNGLIISPNNAPPGVSGFVFNVIDDEEVFVDSDVTDHFVEQNYAIQDHIALKPIHFTLKGLMGELTYLIGQSSNPILNSILALAPLTEVNPEFNVQDSQVYSAIAGAIAQASEIFNLIPNPASLIANLSNIQTQQQAAFNFFLNMRNNRQLVTIQTPYGLLTNYIIESFRALQPGDSRFLSHFTVTFKQIQVVSTAVAPTSSSPNPAGTGTQTGPATNANPPSGITSPSAPSLNNDTTAIPPDNSTSGRITDMTSPPVLSGPTPGLTAEPDTNPAIPVTVPNIFPNNNPIFQTAPLLNTPTPGFIPV